MNRSVSRLIAPLLCGLILGVILGRYSVGSNEPTDISTSGDLTDETCAKYRDKFDSLRTDYLALQEVQAKTVSAASCPDPTMSSNSTVSRQDKSVEDPKENTPSNQPAAPSPESDSAESVVNEHKPSQSTANNEALDIIASIKMIEKEMGHTDTPAEKISFLDRVKLTNPMQTSDSMQPISEKNKFFENLFGEFRAPIQFSDEKRKNGRIKLLIRKTEGITDQKAWAVRIDIDDGQGNASRQHGPLDMLRSVSDRSFAYFLRSSESSYLQMFYRSSSDQFMGNYYEKSGNGEYTKQGIFWLKREST